MIKATISKAHYACSVTNGKHELVADEPSEMGGTDTGLAPNELLMSALASCVAITLRMYIDRKGWEVNQIEVDVTMEVENGETFFAEAIVCTGNITEEQKKSLALIASKCPVSKILSAAHEVRSNVL